MSATEKLVSCLRRMPGAMYVRRTGLAALCLGLGATGMAIAQDTNPASGRVAGLLKARLPKTQITNVDCNKVEGLCEVTAGSNLFYVDGGARYLVVGRVYDMETRQDLTAARLLEINPDMLVGGAARANAGAEEQGTDLASPKPATGPARLEKSAGKGSGSPAPKPASLSLDELPRDGAIVWGNPAGPTVTVFSDFRCSYCRALSAALRQLNVRVIERPISVLGSRDLADRVYCAKNREQALHAAYAGEALPPVTGCDTSGLDANEAFARSHGLTGTPIIVRSDGAMLEGFRPKEFLAIWLKEAR